MKHIKATCNIPSAACETGGSIECLEGEQLDILGGLDQPAQGPGGGSDGRPQCIGAGGPSKWSGIGGGPAYDSTTNQINSVLIVDDYTTNNSRFMRKHQQIPFWIKSVLRHCQLQIQHCFCDIQNRATTVKPCSVMPLPYQFMQQNLLIHATQIGTAMALTEQVYTMVAQVRSSEHYNSMANIGTVIDNGRHFYQVTFQHEDHDK